MTGKPIDDGGQAFPRTGSFEEDGSAEFDSVSQDGMSLRDWFAGMALQGMLASAPVEVSFSDMLEYPPDAYRLADVMIKARGIQL